MTDPDLILAAARMPLEDVLEGESAALRQAVERTVTEVAARSQNYAAHGSSPVAPVDTSQR